MSQGYLRRIKLKEATAPEWAHGVGAFIEGNVLLIGEQASDPKNAPEQQPFCSSKGCSGWLNKLLEVEGIQEEKLFWLNALYNDGTKVMLWHYVDALRPAVVIALGNVASKLCTEQKISHEKCYHPQYWKRIHSKERYALVDLLKRYQESIPDRLQQIELNSAAINRHADCRVAAVS